MRSKIFFIHILMVIMLVVTFTNSQAAEWYLNINDFNYQQNSSNSNNLPVSGNILHVPGDVADFQTAINQVPDGGTIELAAGTYNAPSGGFRILDQFKSFTIQAADGATVTLNGGGNKDILRIMYTDPAQARPITIKGITFANGKSTTAGVAGGVTLHKAKITFIDCKFIGNSSNQTGVAGGVLATLQATVYFFNCEWQNNSAVNYGGGLAIQEDSKVYIYSSKFIGNRTNLPNHSITAAGGAIHVGNSTLRVANTRFENNQAGYVGGALYVIGNWANPLSVPRADVEVANCTFINNQSTRDPSVSFSLPTEGGALHAEAQAILKVFNSRLITNSAMAGGATSIYQARVEFDGAVFLGNRATGVGSIGGYGGAITTNSNDVPSDGSTNRPPVYLSVKNSIFIGRYGTVTTVAQGGGGIYAGGDINRTYGLGGVTKKGTIEENRATVIVDNVIFDDLDVEKPVDDGVGGAIYVDLVNLQLQNSLITHSDAIGTNNSSGGGLSAIDQSLVNISGTTFSKNSTQRYGGAIFSQGSTINMSGSSLIENSSGTDFGSAIFTAPEIAHSLPMNGVIQDCTISNNTGQPIFDDDRTTGPINDVRYNNNHFYHGGANAIVYSDSIYPYSWKTVNQLNSLVVSRSNGTSTPKSQVANTALSSPPVVGAIVAAPNKILMTAANGDPLPPQPAYVGYAWSGASATMDGSTVSGFAGVLQTTSVGTHTLRVGGTPFNAQASTAATPAATFDALLDATGTTLTWSVTAGTFLDAAIDQGVVITPASSGSIRLSTTVEKVYHFYALTQEGGIVLTANSNAPIFSAPNNTSVMVGLNAPNFYGSLQIANLGGGTMNWTAVSSNPNVVQVLTPSGQTEIQGALNFAVTINPQSYPGAQGPLIQTEVVYIDIDAGEAGTQRVTLNIDVLDHIEQVFLPLSIR